VIAGAEFLAEEAEAAAAAERTKPNGRAAESQELGEWDVGEEEEPIPPRGWLLGNMFCRRFPSAT
jgi:hypothetical protein